MGTGSPPHRGLASPHISRLIRHTLLIGVLAIVFAPGAAGSSSSPQHERALAAAMLAPTTTERATVRTVEPRYDALQRVRDAALAGLVLLIACASALWRRRDDDPSRPATAADAKTPRRRGPPFRIA